VFKPGRHYWRYRAFSISESGDKDFSEWSQARTFIVSKDAVAFPQPTSGQIEEMLPKGHPRLFVRPNEIPELIRLTKTDLKDTWKNLVKQADRILVKPPDTSEPPKYPRGVERKSAEWKDIWWGNRTRTISVTDAAATLAFVFMVSGEKKYAEKSRELLLAFCEWDPKGAVSYRYNDEAGMPAMYLPARAYTWLGSCLSDEDREKIVSVMKVRGEDMYTFFLGYHHLWKPYNSHSNRAWHKMGELAIAFYEDIPEASLWLDYAMTVFYTAYPVWGDDKGGWQEGTAYWEGYMSKFFYWADVMRSSFGIDVFERPFYHEAGNYGMYLMPPGTMTGGFADQAILMTSKSIAHVMLELAGGAKNPYWYWYARQHDAQQGSSYLGFLRKRRTIELEEKPPTDLPSSKCFPGVGIAVMNTNLVDGKQNVQIHFKSSPMGTMSHGYNANNAFLLNVSGEPVLLRSGKRDIYGSPHHRDWMWNTKSDNAILLDGEGQIKHSVNTKGRVAHWATSENVDVVAGEAGESYGEKLDRWCRRIVFLKPSVIVVHDVLEASSPSTFQWFLHAPNAFDIKEDRADWNGEQGTVKVHFLEPSGLSISQTDQYDPPPAEWSTWKQIQWHLTAEASEPTTHREFLTLILVNDPGIKWEQEERSGKSALKIQLPESKASLSFEDDRFSVRSKGFRKTFKD